MKRLLILLFGLILSTPASAVTCISEEAFLKVLSMYENKIIGTGILATGVGLLSIVVDNDKDWLIFVQKAGTSLRCLIVNGSDWDFNPAQPAPLEKAQ